ncbi:MAG: hypothetical protein A2Z75_08480 [Chloroflexi bacterium RBG_13_50_10]|nr:MAG: hypothetical protein A2Z75_08480 [Chloroflexi bacterium RBG_13_50_10]
MKKIILFGLLAGLAMLVISVALSLLFNLIFPSVAAEYNNTNLFRPWSDPIMYLMLVEPFILGIILAWIFSITKDLFKTEKAWKKGIYFGLCYWVITIPGMVMSYSSFPISLIMVKTWSISILIQSIVAGLIYARFIK